MGGRHQHEAVSGVQITRLFLDLDSAGVHGLCASDMEKSDTVSVHTVPFISVLETRALATLVDDQGALEELAEVGGFLALGNTDLHGAVSERIVELLRQ